MLYRANEANKSNEAQEGIKVDGIRSILLRTLRKRDFYIHSRSLSPFLTTYFLSSPSEGETSSSLLSIPLLPPHSEYECEFLVHNQTQSHIIELWIISKYVLHRDNIHQKLNQGHTNVFVCAFFWKKGDLPNYIIMGYIESHTHIYDI